MLRSRPRSDRMDLPLQDAEKRGYARRSRSASMRRGTICLIVAGVLTLLLWRYWLLSSREDTSTARSRTGTSEPPGVRVHATELLEGPSTAVCTYDGCTKSGQPIYNTVRWPPIVTRLPDTNYDQEVPLDRNQWPPIVLRVPEAVQGGSGENLQLTGDQSSLCIPTIATADAEIPDTHRSPPPGDVFNFPSSVEGSRSERYLLPLRINEQESKARIHFQQLALLARALNRTLVLPSVGKSRLGTCFGLPFYAYYDPRLEGVDVVTMEEFIQLTTFFKLATQVVSINSKPPGELQLPSTRDGVVFQLLPNHDPSDTKLSRCLSSKMPNLDLRAFTPMEIYPVSPERLKQIRSDASVDKKSSFASTFGETLVQGLIDQHISPNVLAVNYDLRYTIFVEPPPELDYAPKLVALAESVAPRHPYLAIHWRMENVAPEALVMCTESLIDLLEWLLADEGEGIESVWLATDYPLSVGPGATQISKSGTFRDFGEQHREAMEVLKEAFTEGEKLAGWKLATLSNSLLDQGDGGDAHLTDSGVLGILDKIVATKAALFVSGAKGCARSSSYTRQVVETRKTTSGLRNVVELFG